MDKLKLFVLGTFTAGICSSIMLLSIPGDPKNQIFWGFSATRLGMFGGIILVELFLAWTLFHLFVNRTTGQKISNAVTSFLKNDVALFVSITIASIGTAISVVFFISWFILGDKYSAIYLRLAPIIFFLLIFCLQVTIYQYSKIHRAKNGYALLRHQIIQGLKHAISIIELVSRRFSFVGSLVKRYKLNSWVKIILLVILSVYYLNHTVLHAQTQNLRLEDGDQGYFLEFITKVYQSNFHYTGDRNQMPAYAFLQALFYDPSSENAFLQGKYVNIGLSVVVLLLTYILLSKILNRRQALFNVFVITFSLSIFKAGYLQAEILFYFLFFVSFLMMCRMFIAPSMILGISTGVVSGLTQLTKASMLPGLGVFVVFYLLNSLYRRNAMPAKEGASPVYQMRTQVLSLFFLVIGFFGVVFPYITESHQIYGQYFYNVNSTFYMWYDSWEEAEAGTIAHGDRVGWPDMPPDEIPTFSKYIKEHTLDEIKGRVERGVRKQILNLLIPYGQFNYLLILFSCLLIVSLRWYKIGLSLLQKHPLITSFALAFIGAYLSLYAWYRPISGGNRFTYSLYMIILLALVVVLERFFRDIKTIHLLDFPLDASQVFVFIEKIVMILLIYDILFYIPHVMDVGYFGG